MPAPLPEPDLVLEAVEAYLEIAYEGPPPPAVRARVDALSATDPTTFFGLSAFERDPAVENRYHLRLGNRRYPHMKLTLEPSPDDRGYLFKADTHDQHICPAPDSAEHELFRELMIFNRELAAEIGAAWEERGVPTFKAWLRADLARRRTQ